MSEKNVHDIKQTIMIQAPIQKVWEKVSSSEGIEKWFMPNDFKPIVGHEFHLQSPFGPSPCKVLEVEEPTKISFSWDTDGWIVTFLLADVEGKTEFTLIHSGWKYSDEIVPKANEKVTIIRDRMNDGWEKIVGELKKVVEQ
ncbi:SRPBCC family protein [Bacillus dakarensis]|uniref:SRPBCC family protein n=1 Tax=Robertmurraya dakarensis TaxID=1926278 RepID=UPI000980DF7D|nr:SRPBCC domain-containing protein [Bacillus dakarensis]